MSELQHRHTGVEREGTIDGDVTRAGAETGDANVTERPTAPDTTQPTPPSQSQPGHPGFLPSEPPRLRAESVLVRVIATIGIVAICTGLGALLVANDVTGWIVGLAVSVVSVVLAAVLWRTRQM